MPIINCPDCDKEISDAATACPNCGRPNAVVSKIEKSDKKENAGAKVKQKMGTKEPYFGATKKYGIFKGRATRAKYWFHYFICLAFLSFLMARSTVINLSDPAHQIVALYAIPLALMGMSVRRLHDTGRSGWWYLINFIPFLGVFVFIIFAVQGSMPGGNRFGPHPKEKDASN